MLKGTIFDLGETLVHLKASWEQIRDSRIRAIQEALQDRGIALDLNDLTREYVALFGEESDYATRTLIEIEFEKSLARLLERLRVERNLWPATSDLVKRSFEYEIDSYAVFPGVHEMLRQVRDLGFKTGLLSNARSDWAVREIMNRRDLARYFDTIVTSAAVGLRKPRPEPFNQILKLLDLQAGEAVMIGNSLEADIAGARPLGLKTIRAAFSDDTDEGKIDPDITVYRVADIVPAIKRIAASG